MTDGRLRTEEAIIQGYLARLAAGFPGAFGLRDDCAVAAPTPGHEFVFKTDPIAEQIHFLRSDPPGAIGWKALAVNVSDLAAKGARPVAYLLSLSFSEAPEREWMANFADGLDRAQRAFGLHLMGGDTDRRPGPISITPMVVGEVPTGCMVRRAAAQVGDVIFVSGVLGDAALGLRLRQQPERCAAWGLGPSETAQLIDSYLLPQPRLALGRALIEHANAAMDVSDGLIKDLDRMCRASGCAALVQYQRLPESAAMRRVRDVDQNAADAALVAGDDYEVLATVPAGRADAFEASANAAGVAVTAIGRMVAAEPERATVVVESHPGKLFRPGGSGWDHF